jgi:predicted RNase H-like nuclease
MYTFVGFDSAWADNIKAPGALCAVTVANGAPVVCILQDYEASTRH